MEKAIYDNGVIRREIEVSYNTQTAYVTLHEHGGEYTLPLDLLQRCLQAADTAKQKRNKHSFIVNITCDSADSCCEQDHLQVIKEYFKSNYEKVSVRIADESRFVPESHIQKLISNYALNKQDVDNFCTDYGKSLKDIVSS